MPPVCTVSGTICKLDGTPAPSGTQISATVKSTQADQGGQLAGGAGVSSAAIEAFTGDAGTFSIQLIQGSTVLLEIPAINLRKEIVVPAENTADFSTLV
jgi:hypothetical protein